jgi:hypothetical protein
MIDDTTTATTNEICKLAAITKQHLGRLEANGIVRRSGRDQWPLVATMNALLTDAKQRSDAHSVARTRLDDLKAQREKLRLMKECREVCYVREFKELTDQVAFSVLNRLSPLPAQIGGRDLKLRQLVDAKLRDAQNLMSQDMFKLSEQLGGDKDSAA